MLTIIEQNGDMYFATAKICCVVLCCVRRLFFWVVSTIAGTNERSNTAVTGSHGAVRNIHPFPFEQIGTFIFYRAYILKLIYKLDLWFFQL